MAYQVEHHGTSGRWYPFEDNLATMFEALTLCEQVKNDGYGVRFVRQEDKAVVMDAPWQTAIDWSVAG